MSTITGDRRSASAGRHLLADVWGTVGLDAVHYLEYRHGGGTKGRYVDTGELRQHVVTGGQGPPLLLVHGWPYRDVSA